jgi:hypothetical protein
VNAVAAASLADQLTTTLLDTRNSDGGWPYYKGKASRLEPTSAALLALAASAAGAGHTAIDLSPLERWPRRSGLFVDAAREVNFAFNGLAGIALASGTNSPIARELAVALTKSRGIRLPPSTINRQDDAIQAWSWTEGTFSWVESTGWCLLALKRLTSAPRSPQILRRIDDGERSSPIAPAARADGTTATRTCSARNCRRTCRRRRSRCSALHDVAGAPHVTRALQYLEANQQAEAGALALSLACVCLTVYSRPCEQARSALDTQWRRSRFLDNLHVAALALYAATAEGPSMRSVPCLRDPRFPVAIC